MQSNINRTITVATVKATTVRLESTAAMVGIVTPLLISSSIHYQAALCCLLSTGFINEMKVYFIGSMNLNTAFTLPGRTLIRRENFGKIGTTLFKSAIDDI